LTIDIDIDIDLCVVVITKNSFLKFYHFWQDFFSRATTSI